MAANLLAELSKELERVLPLVQALADVEMKGAAAQKLLQDTEARQRRAEHDAVSARQAADASLASIRRELDEKTAAFKAEMVVRHAALTSEYEALQAESKAARLREQEAIRTQKDLLRDLQSSIGLARIELEEVQARLVKAKQEFQKALTAASV